MSVWRQGVGSVVVATLGLMPGLATTCAASCLRATEPAPGAAFHAHHRPAAPAHRNLDTPDRATRHVAGERTQLGVAPVHDCGNHADALLRSSTLSQTARADREVVSPLGQSGQVSLTPSASIARHTRSTHGPPRASGAVTPLVLRI